MNLFLADAEDIRILKKVFCSGHILRENDIYKVVEIVPSGLILALCQNVSKKKKSDCNGVAIAIENDVLVARRRERR